MRGKYSDCTFPDETETGRPDLMDCHMKWRGGLSRGHVFWELGEGRCSWRRSPEFLDWEMYIGFDKDPRDAGTRGYPKVYWQADALLKDEVETVLRYHVLLTRPDLTEEYGDQVRAAGHAHAIAVEKIWSRIFIQDGKLVIDGFDYNLTEEARSAPRAFRSVFDNARAAFRDRFPAHPFFTQTWVWARFRRLVKDFFSGAKQNLVEVQRLAETFALPLGLVDSRGEVYIPESEENLLALPMVSDVLSLLNKAARIPFR